MTAIARALDCATPDTKELTSGEAAKLLHVSRRHLIRLVEAGELTDVRWTFGGHLRIAKTAVLKFKSACKNRQKKSLQVMVRASERLGLYDQELAGVPVRAKR